MCASRLPDLHTTDSNGEKEKISVEDRPRLRTSILIAILQFLHRNTIPTNHSTHTIRPLVEIWLVLFLYIKKENITDATCRKIMDKEHKSNPFDSASVFSRLFFCWLFPLLIKGKKKFLKQEDLYKTSKYHSSEYLGNLLEKEWNKELQKKNPSTVKAILRFIGWKYLIVILFAFIQETVIVISKAYILGLIIYYYDKKSEWNESNVYLLVAGFCGLTAIYSLTFNTNYFITEVLGMKLKVALCTVIYKKASIKYIIINM
ncbi:cystic fibrosis transmembrane conductance regulator-like [Centruroides sculpturatus]|uniref:cystic fibrosis transmembrane conductance regulator-like n=1 Tax=Centruroides sculpturatus TaxID=218467 RepID=UPI000C6E8D78|nr:cystic fibrosis transmembrane conductance regulator-like [Centruroides sculpturatus]